LQIEPGFRNGSVAKELGVQEVVAFSSSTLDFIE